MKYTGIVYKWSILIHAYFIQCQFDLLCMCVWLLLGEGGHQQTSRKKKFTIGAKVRMYTLDIELWIFVGVLGLGV